MNLWKEKLEIINSHLLFWIFILYEWKVPMKLAYHKINGANDWARNQKKVWNESLKMKFWKI